MRIALTNLALSTAIAVGLTVSAHANVMGPAMKPAGGASITLVQHGGGGGGMSHGPSMGAMPGAVARGGGGGTAGGAMRSPAMPTAPNSAEGEFLALPGFGGGVIPDSTPMRQPIVPSVPVLPGQSTLPAPPSVNN